jgi:CheY-like chemotaxis protein
MKLHDQSIRVLVVDDSPVSRKLLQDTLAGTSYEVVFSKEGADALRLFAERPP